LLPEYLQVESLKACFSAGWNIRKVDSRLVTDEISFRYERVRAMSSSGREIPRAVVLLSGGLDSATVLAMARAEGFQLYALSFAYGQRHEIEIEAADRVAAATGVMEHKVARIDLRIFGGSALTAEIEVPRGRTDLEMAGGIPITYVPARNTIFLSYALAWAEVLGAEDIFIGVNAVDYSGYPDCRPEFIEAFEKTARLATRAGVEGAKISIRTPIIDLSKGDIIKRGLELGVDYGLTLTCYDPNGQGQSCGTCDSCLLRLRGFAGAGVADPAIYIDGVVRPDRVAAGSDGGDS
jgi:7-cyano-7-deazaguanine synthase